MSATTLSTNAALVSPPPVAIRLSSPGTSAGGEREITCGRIMQLVVWMGDDADFIVNNL
jgi:hypothetical protein